MAQVADEVRKQKDSTSNAIKVNFIKGPMLDGLRKQIYIDFANNKKTDFMSIHNALLVLTIS